MVFLLFIEFKFDFSNLFNYIVWMYVIDILYNYFINNIFYHLIIYIYNIFNYFTQIKIKGHYNNLKFDQIII